MPGMLLKADLLLQNLTQRVDWELRCIYYYWRQVLINLFKIKKNIIKLKIKKKSNEFTEKSVHCQFTMHMHIVIP
jgi:hypothetical protein